MVKYTNEQRLQIIKNFYRYSESVIATLRSLTPIFGRNSRPSRQVIDVTSERQIYQIRLTERLVSQVQFQKCNAAEIAWMDAKIGIRNKQLENYSPTSNSRDKKGFQNLWPFNEDEIPIHKTVFINELRLSDFKQFLMRNNINSEFSGGVLWCNNSSRALRRIDVGKITLEGCLSDDYYTVRKSLYEQYAIV